MATGIRRESEIHSFDSECDVLVVGLGAAGAAASIDAAAAGAEVVVLERSAAGGGTSAVSGGVIYLGGGTALQNACGFEDSVEDMFAYLMASCGDAPDEAKVRLYCEGSVDHFEWIKAQGVPFKESFCYGTSSEPPGDDGLVFSGSERCSPYREIARPAPRGHVGQIPGQGGPILMKHLCASTERSGARIETNHRVRDLVVDEGGGVVGVVAEHFGEPRHFRARGGVVLTTGGFVLNDEMLSRHVPRALDCQMRVAGDGDDGSGIRLGMAAGAATRNLDKASISLLVTEPWGLKRGVLVNARGQRCIQEDAYMGHLGEQALFHQDGKVWLIVDDEIYEPPILDDPIVAAGDSFEELEAELGMPQGSLVTTLEVYNRHAAEGRDPLFHKLEEYLKPLDKPPYGAIDCSTDAARYAAFTLGGLVTDLAGRVLDPEGVAICGLFAAGRSTSGLSVGGYSSGISLGDSTFFGRRAGLAAAKAAS
jgi:3-oxo-5alpha-steroid 4-dehydrogenase